MKLLLITTVDEYRKIVLEFLKKSEIGGYSVSEIEGFSGPKIDTAAWFPTGKAGKKSLLFFSFTQAEKIEKIISLTKEFNGRKDLFNPIRLAVLPIETFV